MRWLIIFTLIVLMAKANALCIVTTFPSLEEDVKLIAPSDEIYSIPVYSHDYELTPRDIDLLKRADVIVSTAHTHFEMKILELKANGEIKGYIFEIPKVKGLKLLNYPNSSTTNYHMPIYNPENYKVFITALAEVLQTLNPERDYIKKAKDVCREVDEIVKNARRLNGTALVDYPFAQYAVSWLGLEVVEIAFEAPLTPKTFKEVDYIVLTRQNEKSKALLENVKCKYVIYIDSPFVKKSIPEKLRDIEVKEVNETPGFLAILTGIAGVLAWKLRNGF